jgi:LAO/AO transport system kinase
VGQDEVDIVKAAETVAVVLVPGLGDDIQAIKAGILEIGDVFIVNKADREGADRTEAELAMMLDLSALEGWRPPIIRTVAPRGEGIAQAVGALASHGEHLAATGEDVERRRRRVRARLQALLDERFRATVHSRERAAGGLEEAVRIVGERREDPYSASERLFGDVIRARSEG